MKKSLLLSVCVLISGLTSLSAQCVSLFSQGFESGTLTLPWTTGTGIYTNTIPSGSAPSGTYNLMMNSTGTNSFYQGVFATFTPGQPTYMSWWMRTDVTNAANGYVVIGDANIASDNGVIFCYFNAASELRFFNTGGYNHPIVANTWYHVEARNMNWTTRTSDIYVNNVLILTSWAFRSGSATSIDRVHLFSLSASNPQYDEFTIGDPAVTVSSVSTSPTCFGSTNGNATVTAGGGTGAFTYSWSPSGGTAATENGIGAGTYVCTVTDAVGCTNTSTVVLTEPTALVTAAANSGDVCSGDTAMLIGTVMGGTMGYTYDWTPGNMPGSVAAANPAVTTTYTLLVTDANGCTDTSTTTVNVYAAPVVSLGADATFCGSGILDAQNAGSNFFWNDGSTTQMITVSFSGPYYVAVTDSNGCVGMDTINVTVGSNPVVVGSAAMNFVCTGEPTVQLFGSPAGGTWTGIGVFANTFEPDTAGAGVHNLVYLFTDSLGCSGVDTVSITVDLCLGANAIAGTDLNVYPNPSNGTFEIIFAHASADVMINITDAAGRSVYSSTESSVSTGTRKQIDLSAQADGIYLLQVNAGVSNSVYRIAVQH